MNRRGHDIVTALAEIHVIVRVHGLAETLGRQPRDHLVSIHVAAGRRARLKDVNRKLRVVATCGDFSRGRADRAGEFLAQQSASQISLGGSRLDQSQCADKGAGHAQAADGEILHGALCLRAPKRVTGHGELTHAVMFDAKVGGLHYDVRVYHRMC